MIYCFKWYIVSIIAPDLLRLKLSELVWRKIAVIAKCVNMLPNYYVWIWWSPCKFILEQDPNCLVHIKQ